MTCSSTEPRVSRAGPQGRDSGARCCGWDARGCLLTLRPPRPGEEQGALLADVDAQGKAHLLQMLARWGGWSAGRLLAVPATAVPAHELCPPRAPTSPAPPLAPCRYKLRRAVQLKDVSDELAVAVRVAGQQQQQPQGGQACRPARPPARPPAPVACVAGAASTLPRGACACGAHWAWPGAAAAAAGAAGGWYADPRLPELGLRAVVPRALLPGEHARALLARQPGGTPQLGRGKPARRHLLGPASSQRRSSSAGAGPEP
jgi:hypothetical protein